MLVVETQWEMRGSASVHGANFKLANKKKNTMYKDVEINIYCKFHVHFSLSSTIVLTLFSLSPLFLTHPHLASAATDRHS